MSEKAKTAKRDKIPVKPRKLTLKMERFIEAYLLDPCASRSAITAGYSKKTAYCTGPALLKNPLIADSIRERRKEDNEANDLDKSKIIAGLEKNIKQARKAKQFAVVSRCYELLGKIEGCLDNQVKKVELTGKDGGPLEYSDKSESELRESITHRLRGLREGADTALPN